MCEDRPVWAEIMLDNIIHNYNEVKRLIGPGVQVMAIVKANAYGHGAAEAARALEKAGADCFGVALMNEAVHLRTVGIVKPILILGWTPEEDYSRALDHGITLTVFSLKEAEKLSQISIDRKTKARVHLKIDTGMGRLGLAATENGIREAVEILALPGLLVEGIFTHLAKADERDKTFTTKQIELFQKFVSNAEEAAGKRFPLKHAANSAAIIDHPEAHFDLVRPGIILYGLRPSDEVNLDRVELRQAIALRARISHIKKVARDTPISYGGRFITTRESVIATLPLGYADGYSRLLSGKAQVIHKGKRAPIVGRVCMDQLMFDATDLGHEVKQGDIVTMIGIDNDIFISVDELAGILGTINYEITCMISARVPRVY